MNYSKNLIQYTLERGLYMKNINLKKITYDNLETAVKIQNTIFPEEDGRVNFLEAINHDPYRKEMDYYIAYAEATPIGVTGIYAYHEYPETAWLGWFGILPEFRNVGYGSFIFDLTEILARKKKYKEFRLYTDDTFQDAQKLYTKKGMIKEIYDNPDDKDPYYPDDANTYIFSKSLTAEEITLWNSKPLGLKEQGMKEH